MIVKFNYSFSSVEIEFNHDIITPRQVNSFGGLSFLKEIELTVRNVFLTSLNGHFYIKPGIKSTSVYLFEESDFNKIKTSIRRDYIINNILNEHD